MTTDSSKPSWTFLTNHGHVLLLIAQQPSILMREMAESMGVTERCVQRILHELEEAGYITRVHQGRRNHYEVHMGMPLRHPAAPHQQVSALVSLMLDDDADHQEEKT